MLLDTPIWWFDGYKPLFQPPIRNLPSNKLSMYTNLKSKKPPSSESLLPRGGVPSIFRFIEFGGVGLPFTRPSCSFSTLLSISVQALSSVVEAFAASSAKAYREEHCLTWIGHVPSQKKHIYVEQKPTGLRSMQSLSTHGPNKCVPFRYLSSWPKRKWPKSQGLMNHSDKMPWNVEFIPTLWIPNLHISRDFHATKCWKNTTICPIKCHKTFQLVSIPIF